MFRIGCFGLACALGVSLWGTASAQVVPDRVDPSLVTRSLPSKVTDEDAARERVAQPATTVVKPAVVLTASNQIARSVVVQGADAIPAADFISSTKSFLGRPLSQEDLRSLAGAVAGVARGQGFVLATASIEPQGLANGQLIVTLDEGRVDAARSIGVSSAAADRLLSALVTHRAVTKRELERTMLLISDLPGVRVKDTRYMRQNGFGILIVTLTSTKVSAYFELDNRGTREIGPLRGVGLVNIHGALKSSDELTLVTAVTPANPHEFTFVSGRYAAPVGDGGGAASISGFYGRTHAGGSFSDLALIGNSYGIGVGYTAALTRTRRQSLWFDADLHTIVSNQSAQGYRFRDDHLTVLSGTLRSNSEVGGGLLHLSAQANIGLPILDATRAGDPLASRTDGDARFVTGVFQADWTRTITGPVSIAVASIAQIASRPLLATAQISLGGPAFARAYDYSERTGDQGVLGSAEVRIDLARLFAPTAQRVQFYGFGDGGTVSNLRGASGGGSLASSGVGLRVGQGRVDGGFEVAFPIGHERLESGNRAPRVSGTLSIHF